MAAAASGRSAATTASFPSCQTPTSTFWLDVKAGPALGVLAEQRYPERTFVPGVDDLLVMVTDGITDPLATDLDLLGLAALARIVSGVLPDPKELCGLLLPAAGRSRPSDDAAVLAVLPGVICNICGCDKLRRPSSHSRRRAKRNDH